MSRRLRVPAPILHIQIAMNSKSGPDLTRDLSKPPAQEKAAKMQLVDHKDGGWCILNPCWGTQNRNPGSERYCPARRII
jgi:hypothetical protein